MLQSILIEVAVSGKFVCGSFRTQGAIYDAQFLVDFTLFVFSLSFGCTGAVH